MTEPHASPRDDSTLAAAPPHEVDRRRFMGYLVRAATLVAAADLGISPAPATAAVPSPPQAPDLYDLNDMLTDAARPTSHLITVEVHKDGTASFALPRAEVGQGITTSSAMLIAEELDIPLHKVKVTLAKARPELMFNQLTGGSNTTISTFTPIRVAAAIAKGALLEAAAIALGAEVARLEAKDGVVTAPDGRSMTYGELAGLAASPSTRPVTIELKPRSQFRVIGRPRNRVDALEAVTGRKRYAMDLDVKGALPTMVCRPPTLNGSPKRVRNKARVLSMPGVTHVVKVPTGVAVRARTFGQCIDAIRALDVDWNPGSVEGESDKTILAELRAAELPMDEPSNPLAKSLDVGFTFYFRSQSALEPNTAVADVRKDRAEIWSALKSPIVAKQEIAQALGLPADAVTVHVVQGGGSFGRRLFFDAALEAALISQKMGRPVKLMWHRADEPRQGRAHPMCTSRIRATYAGGQVLTFQQHHTSVSTDFTHGLGEIITAMSAKLPSGNPGFAATVFRHTQEIPYDFGAVNQTLTETDERFNTGSMRNVYSPDVRCAAELAVDQLARRMRTDPYRFRRRFLSDDRARAALDKVAKAGDWGRRMPRGTAQGIAIHREYKGVSAALVEIDCRPRMVDRKVRNAVTGPRVTKVVFAIDAGLVVNPRGLEAQMMGGVMDGIALALTSSIHLRDGHFLEASWDNYFYTRQWNTPPDLRIIILPSTSDEPGGAGELAVAASMAAVACAYGRATGTMPTSFPINHGTLSFEVKPTVPPIPASPTDGLTYA
jgi:isoquinoline 1-oxidoreductase subunit beta